MGPGLFLALALAVITPASAERAVGLEAQGVDVMAAVDNPGHLDVRDELGRPVSGQLVSAQLKQAQVRKASEAAYASTLPQAAAVAALLEMIQALRLAMRGGTTTRTPLRLFALAPSTRSPLRALVLMLIAMLSAVCVSARRARCALVLPASPAASPLVLRC